MNETFSSIEYNGVTYEVEDESKSGIYTVIGTQTASTNAWTGTINVPALYDGITIAYYLPRTSWANVTLNLTLADGTTTTGAIPVYFSGTTRMGTEYAPGSTIVLTYWSSGSISVNGTATTEDRWTHADYYNNTVPTAYCNSAPSTAAKVATCTNYSLLSKSYVPVNIVYTNSAASAITLNVNSTGAKPIYINGTASSSSNYTLPAGIYIAYYDGTNYQFRTDGVLPGKVLEATIVNGHTVNKDVPSNAVFTDTQANWTQTTTTALDYIKNKPTLGTAAAKDVPASGNASTVQVVMGNDTRLSNARPASDVSSWAKASTKPTYTAAEVGLGNVGNFKAVSTVASQGLSTTEQSNARANIGAGTSNFSGAYNDLTGKPTLGTAAAKDVPTSGNASTAQVVMGNDTRLTNARTPSSHNHGNIFDSGALQTNDITIASGDKLVVTDSSDSGKVARTSVSFDGSNATRCLTKKGTWESFTDIVPSAYCETAASTAAKTATCTGYTLTTGNYIQVIMKIGNSYSGPITLAINGTTAKPIYINGTASSSTNKTLLPGSYEVYYDGTAYQFRTDGVLPGSIEKSKEVYQELVSSTTSGVFYPILFNSSSYQYTDPLGPSASGYDGVSVSPYLYYNPNKGIFIKTENSETGYCDSYVQILSREDNPHITIGKYLGETISGVPDKSMGISYEDISLSDRWDGTHFSLKETVSSINTSIGTKADKSDAIKNITRSGTTFTATRANGTTFSFTQQDNNTTYAAGTALSLDSNNKFNHSTYVSAGTAGTSSATHGATLSVPYITVNAQGHVTAKGTHTHTVEGLQYHTANISRVVMMSDGQVSVQTKGYLSINNYDNTGFKPISASSFDKQSSRKIKKNIKPITNEEAYKLLEVNPVSFDYIEQVGGEKNQFGVIAEEVNETIPFVVDIPENYDENSDDYMRVPSIDYSKFVPHMIKLIQLQEEKIESMNQEIEKLKSFVYQT